MLSFPPFEVDLENERLWKNGEIARLRRKPFAILRHLVQHPQRLVTHEELVDAVWGKSAMSESLLRTHLCDLRQVLGEGVVETVVGRGYRFEPQVTRLGPEPARRDGATASAKRDGRVVVGRETEVGLLHAALRSAAEHRRTAVFITGQAGTGKTTLVNAFLEEASDSETVVIGAGACIEQHGSGQAYLPVLDAIGALLRGGWAERTIEVFTRHAPSWLVQFPGFIRPERLGDLQRRAAGATQARMVCELAEALEVLCVDAPVIVVFEDLHWTDPSTAELISFLANRREPARLLLLGTYRPEEALRGQALSRLTGELIAHRLASSVALHSFGPDTLEAYLRKRYPAHVFPAELARTLERSTGGNPLFLATLVDELEAERMIQERKDRWELSTSVEDVAARRPDSIRRLIDTQIDRLSALDQRIVEVAAIAGMTFAAGVVAHALATDSDTVDSACESLANGRKLLQYAGTETWPDGTIQTRYAFRHVLFQHAALARSTAATVRSRHRKIAECIEAGYGEQEDAMAVELAVHFELGRLPAKAALYHVVAGERATRRCCYKEATAHQEQARDLLNETPEGRERDRLELRVSLSQGWSDFQANGGIDTAIARLQRAIDLARRLNVKAALGEAIIRLQTVLMVRGDLHEASAQGSALGALFDHVSDPALRLLARQVEATTALLHGRFEEAGRLLGALGVFDAAQETTAMEAARAHLLAFSMGSFALWLRGEPDRAVTLSARAQQVAAKAYDPFDHEYAAMLAEGALLHAWRREPERAAELAAQALVLAEKGSFAKWQTRAALILRWATAVLTPTLSREAVDELLNKPWEEGSVGRTMHAMLYIAMCVRLGRSERALEMVESTLATIERSEERWLEPEIHRLRGEALRSRDDIVAAGRAFGTAIAAARKLGASSLELRATLSLHALATGAKKKRARDDVARLLSVITEAQDTPDLVDARAVVG